MALGEVGATARSGGINTVPGSGITYMFVVAPSEFTTVRDQDFNTVQLNPANIQDVLKYAVVYSLTHGEMQLEISSIPTADATFSGGMLDAGATQIKIGRDFDTLHTYKIGEIQRYDITSYAEGKTIIDELML